MHPRRRNSGILDWSRISFAPCNHMNHASTEWWWRCSLRMKPLFCWMQHAQNIPILAMGLSSGARPCCKMCLLRFVRAPPDNRTSLQMPVPCLPRLVSCSRRSQPILSTHRPPRNPNLGSALEQASESGFSAACTRLCTETGAKRTPSPPPLLVVTLECDTAVMQTVMWSQVPPI